jgi:hypothetical protein
MSVPPKDGEVRVLLTRTSPGWPFSWVVRVERYEVPHGLGLWNLWKEDAVTTRRGALRRGRRWRAQALTGKPRGGGERVDVTKEIS